MMKAAVVGASGVEIREVPKPTPGPTQVLVRVRASGLNRADLIMASGRPHGAHGAPAPSSASSSPVRWSRPAGRWPASRPAIA